MSKKNKIRRQKATRVNSLQFVNLENRNLMAGIFFNSDTGVITVDGTNQSDFVRVTQTVSTTKVDFSGVDSKSYANNQVNSIVFLGRSGDDWFRNDTAIRAQANGHSGNDTLIGGSDSDQLRGGEGNDRIYGNGGNDSIYSDQGDDFVRGGDGNDQIFGGLGRDRFYGDAGDDTISGGEGNDFVDGGDGHDRLYGHSGDDYIVGGIGNDVIAGQDGDDSLFGNDGDDSLYGNNGVDFVNGQNGADQIVGGEGNDSLMGSLGLDVLFGQGGDDWLHGGDDNNRLFGDDGNDDLIGGNSDDFLRGGMGLDRLFGQGGRDDLSGDDDNDDLYGGLGDDILRGGRGNDDYFRDSSDSVFDDFEDYGTDGDFEIRGSITNLNTTTKTFELLGLNVNYSNAAVRTTLADGNFIKVEGLFESNRVTAREIEFENDQNHHNFESRGVVSSLDTSAKTFSFLGFTVNYNNASVSQTLANGQSIELEGTLAGNNISAHRIGDDAGGRQRDTNGAFELRGAISELNAEAKTFKLMGISVNYSSSQIYGLIANGSFVKVDGAFANNILTARQVETELPGDRDENLRALGEIQNLNSTLQRFEFLGFIVDYSQARVETSLTNGKSIELRGWLTNNSIVAERIDT